MNLSQSVTVTSVFTCGVHVLGELLVGVAAAVSWLSSPLHEALSQVLHAHTGTG